MPGETPVTPEVAPEVAPAEPAPEVTPEATPAEPAPAVSAEPVLYELPDGRKVDAETLQREWKENFLPDYTRKSQELAKIKQPKTDTPEDVPYWKQPGYTPKSYDELIEIGAQEALARIERRQQEEAQQRAQIAAQVETQLSEIKAADPKLDENALFLHASKYGFRDLKLAYDNYRVMRDAATQAEARAVQNLQARGQIPVAPPAGATPPAGDSVDPSTTQKFGSAREFLASLKG